MESMTIRRRVEQWEAKHGSDGILIDGWIVFSDGAMREASTLYGVLIEPPGDSLKRLKVQQRYRETKLQWAIAEFSTLKQQMLAMAKQGFSNTDDTERLKELQQMVFDCKRHADAVREKISREPNVRENLRAKAEQEQRKQELQSAINAIEI